MGEPLDGKFEPYGCFSMKDVKSAVEWLKSNLKDFESDARKVIYDKIDQAFPDLNTDISKKEKK